MGFARTGVRRPGRRIATGVVLAALAATGLASGSATAASSAPQAPIGAYLQSSDLARPQFCSDGKPVSRTRTPTLGVGRDAPAFDGHPNLKASFEVVRPGGALVARATVPLPLDPATFQIPEGVLDEGEYQFRVRAVEGHRVSAWLPWCGFTVETVGVPTPSVPVSLRVSAYPYAGFQFCGAVRPVVLGDYAPTFAASLPAGFIYPNLVARFEVARPGLAPLILVGNPYGEQAPIASLPTGSYQFRARFEEGDQVSAWSPWCGFDAE